MTKNKNEFELILVIFSFQRLEPGIHYYKFIVDNEWCFSPDDDIIHDENGNINNVIDTRNYQKSSVRKYGNQPLDKQKYVISVKSSYVKDENKN